MEAKAGEFPAGRFRVAQLRDDKAAKGQGVEGTEGRTMSAGPASVTCKGRDEQSDVHLPRGVAPKLSSTKAFMHKKKGALSQMADVRLQEPESVFAGHRRTNPQSLHTLIHDPMQGELTPSGAQVGEKGLLSS